MWTTCITKILFIPLFYATNLQARPLTFYAWWLKTRRLTQGCAFLALVDIAAHLGDQTVPKPQFWGHFPAKHAKYCNVRVIKKTNASIITIFCRMIDTPKYSLRVVLICPWQIQDGGRPPSLKIGKSSQPNDWFWRNLACSRVSILWTPLANKISWFQKSKMAVLATLKIQKIAISVLWMDQFRENLAWWCASILETSAYKILCF